MVDMVQKKTDKFVFYAIADTAPKREYEVDVLQDFLKDHDQDHFNYAIERTPFSVRLWVDDEELAMIVSLGLSWPQLKPDDEYRSQYQDFDSTDYKVLHGYA